MIKVYLFKAKRFGATSTLNSTSEKNEHSGLEYKKLLCNWSLISGHGTVLKEIHIHLHWKNNCPAQSAAWPPFLAVGLDKSFLLALNEAADHFNQRVLPDLWKVQWCRVHPGNVLNSNIFYPWHMVCSPCFPFQLA